MEKMIVGTATRYIAGRNAVQTVYWRKSKDVQVKGFVKYNKMCNFGIKEGAPQQNSEAFAQIRNRYS